MATLDINRYIGKIRADLGSNFLALALTEIQNWSHGVGTTAASTPAPVTAPVIGGGGSVATPQATSSPPFQLMVNGAVVPNNAANLNDALPPPGAGNATAKWQVDATIPKPNVSVQYNNLANSLIAVNVVAYSATPVFNASLGNTQKITLTGNVTSFTVINPTVGQQLTIVWLQDSAGGHTVAGAPATLRGFTTPGTTLSTYSAQSFVWDGAVWVATAAGIINI